MPEGPSKVVVLGSLNPVKASGVRRAYEAFYGHVSLLQVGVSVPTRQPVGLNMTARLACLRAEQASRAGEGDWVGVEAGLVRAGGRWLVINVACLMRGRKRYIGLSPSFQIPSWLARMAREGELDEALEMVTGIRDLGSGIGAIGLMSGGRVVREDLVYWATTMALASAEGELAFRRPSR